MPTVTVPLVATADSERQTVPRRRIRVFVAAMSLVGGHQVRHSTPGLILAAASLIVMPVLSIRQRHAGRELNSRFAALVIAAVAVKEGREAWRGDACCAPTGARTTEHRSDTAVDSCCATDSVASVDAGPAAVCGDGCDCCRPTAPAHVTPPTEMPTWPSLPPRRDV